MSWKSVFFFQMYNNTSCPPQQMYIISTDCPIQNGSLILYHFSMTPVLVEILPFVKWARAQQNQPNEFCTQWTSDQPGHTPSLITALAVRLKIPWALSYPLSAQRTLIRLGGCPGWSVFAGRIGHFVGFVMLRLKYKEFITFNIETLSKLLLPQSLQIGKYVDNFLSLFYHSRLLHLYFEPSQLRWD